MKPRLFLIASCLVLISTIVMTASSSDQPPASLDQAGAGESLQRTFLCGGEPCDAVLRGLGAFFDRRLHGLGANGRSCADCHMATDNFQLSPASAEARFRFLEWRRRWNPNADDPLFRPIDADDFRTNGENASDFSNLRQKANALGNPPIPPPVATTDGVNFNRQPRPEERAALLAYLRKL